MPFDGIVSDEGVVHQARGDVGLVELGTNELRILLARGNTGVLVGAASSNLELHMARGNGGVLLDLISFDMVVLTESGGARTGYVQWYSGSAWVSKPVKVFNGAVWQVKPAKTWDGSQWVLGN